MAYVQRWEDYFKNVLDADGNGFIEPADAHVGGKGVALALGFAGGTPAYENTVKSFENLIRNIIHDFDDNKDGKVSLEELQNNVKKFFVGQPIDSLPEWWKENVRQFYRIGDPEGTGREVPVEEFIKLQKIFPPHASPETVAEAYQWAKANSPSKKLDFDAINFLTYTWASSPDPQPYIRWLFPNLYVAPVFASS